MSNASKRFCLYYCSVFLCFFVLRLAAFSTAFCRILPCVLPLNAVQFVANSTFFVVNCPPFCINTHLCTAKWFANIIQANANFSPKEPPRELNICHRMGNWWTARALSMLKFTPKILRYPQKHKMCLTINKVKTSIRHFGLCNTNLNHHNIQQGKDKHKALRVMQYKS